MRDGDCFLDMKREREREREREGKEENVRTCGLTDERYILQVAMALMQAGADVDVANCVSIACDGMEWALPRD